MSASADQVECQLNGRAYRFPPVALSRLPHSFNVFREPASRLQFAVVQRPVASLIVLPAHLGSSSVADPFEHGGFRKCVENRGDAAW